MPTRREFLGAPGLLLGLKSGRAIAGSFVNDSHVLGHRLRDRQAFRTPERTIKVPVVIVGGGIAGLSAAWRLDKRGFRDFVLLEMEREPGGNSRSGRNDITPYPWAAHYVPVPGAKAALVRELFEELGVLAEGKWDERSLCFSPQERLYLHGRWQEGIEPEIAATAQDREQYRRFNELVAQHRATGQFTIPLDEGARSSPLDQMTVAQWLAEHKLDSPYLNWYLDYACRDDYGAHATGVSAFMGIHYFASREHEEKGPLTWPEGNGWIVNRLVAKLKPYIRTGAVVHSIRNSGLGRSVLTADAIYLADAVIFAAPTFLAPYIIEDAPPVRIEYSPWVTANLTLDRMPREKDLEPAWDNVIHDSASLGYVVATHQSVASRTERSVWTWYHALAGGAPAENRRLLLDRDWQYWKDFILNDLARAHPDIRECVSRIDVMRLGHAMARPIPGSIFSPARRRIAEHAGPVFFANSDVSGYSIFEEAQYRGARAAERALRMVAGG